MEAVEDEADAAAPDEVLLAVESNYHPYLEAVEPEVMEVETVEQEVAAEPVAVELLVSLLLLTNPVRSA